MGAMTGDASQPGETPRTEASPWSWADADTGAWWRGDFGPVPANPPGTGSAPQLPGSAHNPATAPMPARPRAVSSRPEAAAASAAPAPAAPEPAAESVAGPAAGAAAESVAGPVAGTATGAAAESVAGSATGAEPAAGSKPTAWPSVAPKPTAAPRPAPGPRPAAAPMAAAEAAPARVAATMEPPAPAQHTGEAAGAHEAGARDVTAALSGDTPRGTAVFEASPAVEPKGDGTAAAQAAVVEAEARDEEPRAAAKGAEEESRAAAKGVERDHDEVDAVRFNTEGSTSAYAAVEEAEDGAVGVPDVMVLPEPQRDRPTVVLDRRAVPGQAASDRPRPVRNPQDRDRATRALQDRVRAERTSALLETSPFWLGEERAAAEPSRQTAVPVPRPPRKKAREPRRPLSGLLALLALALVATFFSWVSAEPFWLAVGHGQQGDATVSRCTGSGFTQRCVGEFTAANGEYTVQHVTLLGVDRERETARARMVSSDSRQVYVGDTGVLVHLRWTLGFLLVLLCGLGIAGLTGVRRLENVRARRSALLLSVAGPLALLVGFLAAAY